ncbi:carboxylesterase/lipase family protein [Microlunatus parietis]|uniref:Para-nitrobenzyl esterase n=1 Tax=Microlunatus parietis TaxID=682979 RepID=A0A7Y9ID50_9ACTN|nr:carboxylesterase family protein [Microlunatus parietis]NYE74604.1 para-nitrobenzyl esterase [Microlunatus parietis]
MQPHSRLVRTMIIRTVAAAVCAVALIVSGTPAQAQPRPGRATARLDSGWVRGAAGAGVTVFSGIPYAAPPTGDRRFAPPAAPEPWIGNRDATAPSPSCPQPGGFDAGGVRVAGQEDCLYLDAVVPRRSGHRRLPVIVWLHGGGMITGAAGQYDATRLASRGDAIVITANYRLGALGFLATPALDAGGVDSGNYGLLDQHAVLRWVRTNAAALGGDPGRVTLAGQSAGARSACAHLAAPAARGLFARAILQSGPCAVPFLSRAEADRNGETALAEVGCAGAADPAGCLRALPVADLAALLPDFGVPAARRPERWGPVAGTTYLPEQPIAALRRGSAAGVDLLLGTTRDESRSFVLTGYPNLTAEGYAAELRAVFGDDADAVRETYPAAESPSPVIALATVQTDRTYACPGMITARTASRYSRVYAYEFAEDSGLMAGGQPMGATHGWDLPFLWTLRMPQAGYPDPTTAQARLSDTMIDYWTAFAHRGRPASPGAPQWPAFGPRSTVLGLSTEAIRPVAFADDHRCAFWAAIERQER